MNALTTNLLAAMSRSRFILFIIRGRNLRQIQIGLCVCYILSLSGNVLLFHFHPPGPVPASGSASRANSLSFFSSPSITSSGDSMRTAAITTTTTTAADTVTAETKRLLGGGGNQGQPHQWKFIGSQGSRGTKQFPNYAQNKHCDR